jgi:hypothetical protein
VKIITVLKHSATKFEREERKGKKGKERLENAKERQKGAAGEERRGKLMGKR